MSLRDQACDLCFVGGAPVALDDRRGPRDLLGRGLGHPEHLGEGCALSGGGGRPREGEQDSALALAQVVSGGLAGHSGISEDTQVVIAQLEGQAPGGQDRLQDLDQWESLRERGSPADSTQNAGVDHRVVSGLVEGDLQGGVCTERVGALGVQRVLFGQDVEILAQGHLGVHVGETLGERLDAVGAQLQSLLIGLRRCRREKEITHEDGGIETKGAR